MNMQTLKAEYPKLREALDLLAIYNQGVTNEDYIFPKEAEDSFLDAERVLCAITEEERDTVLDGEWREAEAILARFGDDGTTLNGLLEECFEGDYMDCSKSPLE